MKIIKFQERNEERIINRVVKVLQRGELVVSPSDTVYGLLADATNEKAVEKLIEFKSRPRGKAISVFVSDFTKLKQTVSVNKSQEVSLIQLLPGPFTLVLDSKHKVSGLLESEKGTLGVRIPDNSFILKLSEKFGKPITATSANMSGKSPVYSIRSLLKQLSSKKEKLLNMIIDQGKLPRNKPSTVIDLTTAKVKIIRKGDIIFHQTRKYLSESPDQTKKIARFILSKAIGRVKKAPLIFILQGELGTGKTVFTKGLAEFLGIKNIISPTFVVYYEYTSINRLIEVFVHIDLYNVQDPEEFQYLGLEKYLKPKNLLCFEWGEKAGEIMGLLKQKGQIVYIKIKYLSEKKREILVKN